VGGGAWPFLVGGVICLVNSDNERDSSLLTRRHFDLVPVLPAGGRGGLPFAFPPPVSGRMVTDFLEGQAPYRRARLSNNRSVMPLDVRGRTRATLKASACVFTCPGPTGPGNPLNRFRARDRGLQLFPVNEEFLVSASHKLALITSLPFVHTARRYYRLDGLVRPSDRSPCRLQNPTRCDREDGQT
jgi:hypothetical protein